jgi:hypothetical protein
LCDLCLSAVEAVRAVRVLEASVVNPALKFSRWRFHNSQNPNTCFKCEDYDNDVFELEDSDDLHDIFPYGVFVADDTFACNVHPHCACFCVDESDLQKT